MEKSLNSDVMATASFQHQIKGSIAGLKRRIKNGEEEIRTGIGVVRKSVGLEKAPLRNTLFEPRAFEFRDYEGAAADVPMKIVTPSDGAYMHTFFDVCPLSASGRYLAVTRLPFEHRSPYPGDVAEICVIDLHNSTITTVYQTTAWALQLGANIQWHPSNDDLLFCNSVENGVGVGVRIDLQSKQHRVYKAPFYAIDPKGQYMLGPALDLVNRTQIGYGIPEPYLSRRKPGPGASENEGIWHTDLETGKSELLVTIHDLVRQSPDYELLMTGTNLLFHTKINRQGNRLFQVLRSVDLADRPGVIRSRIMSLDPSGSHIRDVLPHEAWDRGGHHPSWLADGTTILMNLVPDSSDDMRFVTIDDKNCQRETLGNMRGSGHPTIESSGRFLITDAYLNEGFGEGQGTAPLRLIDLRSGEEHHIAQMDCGPPNLRARRVDPHPVWSRDERRIVTNGVVNGKRQVMIADPEAYLKVA